LDILSINEDVVSLKEFDRVFIAAHMAHFFQPGFLNNR
jgi:hypothetical protein